MAAGGGVGRRIRMPRRRRAWVSCRWASTISAGGPSPTFPSRRRRRRRHRHSPQRSRSDGQRNPHVQHLRQLGTPPRPAGVSSSLLSWLERLVNSNSHVEQTKNGSLRPLFDVGWAVCTTMISEVDNPPPPKNVGRLIYEYVVRLRYIG